MGLNISQDDIPKCQMLQITTATTEESRGKNEMMMSGAGCLWLVVYSLKHASSSYY